MGHRYLPNPAEMFDIDQGHGQDQGQRAYIHIGRAALLENGSVNSPVESMLTSGMYCPSRRILHPRPNDRSLSNIRLEGPHMQTAVAGPSCDPYSNFPAARSLYVAPGNNMGHVYGSYYHGENRNEHNSGLFDPMMNAGRGPFKRKSPSISVACERGNFHRIYGEGSSSSTDCHLEKAISGYQNHPINSFGLPHNGVGNISADAAEDSLRNVRSRPGLEMENNSRRTHLSSYSCHRYGSSSHFANDSITADIDLNAHATARQHSHISVSAVANGRNLPSGNTGFGNGIVHRSAEIGGYHREFNVGRSRVSPQVHGPHDYILREDHYLRRGITPNSSSANYSIIGRDQAYSRNGLQVLSENFSPRYSRPMYSGNWHNSHRDGRSRIPVDRFQPLSVTMAAHETRGSEAPMLVDRSYIYGSRNWYDEHRDMRLDIDNMSYEELLALEERIGNVSTGLSEDMVPNCLMETTRSDSENQGTCVICLEECKGEEVGILKNCGHGYHACCIKKWLSMKNSCPICKAPALEDKSKE